MWESSCLSYPGLASACVQRFFFFCEIGKNAGHGSFTLFTGSWMKISLAAAVQSNWATLSQMSSVTDSPFPGSGPPCSIEQEALAKLNRPQAKVSAVLDLDNWAQRAHILSSLPNRCAPCLDASVWQIRSVKSHPILCVSVFEPLTLCL